MTGDVTVQNLRQRLEAMLKLRPPEYQALLVEIADHLNATARDNALKPGDPMPEFVLPNADGALISSATLLAAGPLVLVFVRGGWCPFCSATLAALDAVVPDLAALGGRLVAFSPDAAGQVDSTRRRLGLRFDLLCDIDSGVALSFGVTYRVPAAYRDILMTYGIDLLAWQGDGPGLLSIPATFVADAGGMLRFASVSASVTQRVEPMELAGLVAPWRG